VKVLEVGGERYVVSLTGTSGWVCNLRWQNTARLRIGRRVDDVVATEMSDDEKPPIARAYLDAATRSETRGRLAWAAEGAPEAEVRRGAAGMPIFRLTARVGSHVSRR
jgi:hypothetical protein